MPVTVIATVSGTGRRPIASASLLSVKDAVSPFLVKAHSRRCPHRACDYSRQAR